MILSSGESVRPALRSARLMSGVTQAMGREAPLPLGGLAYGALPPWGRPAVGTVALPVLSGAAPVTDVWFDGGAAQQSGECGSVRWRHDGTWLYGVLELEQTPADADFDTLCERAYCDVFETLAHTGYTHLLRLWNYLPRINDDEGGLERYRRFNVGRQRAFLRSGHPAFVGAPAACALGTRSGPLCVHFLAGREAPLAVENPRQVSAYAYPDEYGPRSPSFSRAVLAEAGAGRVALLISGTSSIVGHRSVHADDPVAQTRETLANLRAVLQSAHAHTSARFDLAAMQCTVYLRHAAHLEPIRATLQAEIGRDAEAVRTALYLQADICRSDLLVEIEAHALAAGRIVTDGATAS